ncbi:MAG: hypothetical protein WBY38_11075 [Candidatus Acidiferrales bacterium]
MPVSATDAIDVAMRHAKAQLFQPFRFGQWWRLALVGLLAGEMGSAGGCNSNVNLPGRNFPWPGHQTGSSHIHNALLPSQWANDPALVAGVVAILLVAGLALLVIFTYVSSVMRFVLFDSIIAKECHIRAGWARRRQPGFRLFVWRILFLLVSSAAFLIVIGVPVGCAWALGWFVHPGEHILRLMLAGLLLLVIFLVIALVAAVIQVMTKDFVVPQMALEDISAFEGWRRLWLWLKNDKGGYAGYVAMKIVLAIGAAIVFAIVTAVALLFLLIPIGGAGVAAVLAAKAAGWTWTAQTIALAAVAGCIALAILVFAAALIYVPAVVFLPAYSIYFFAPRYALLAALLWPQPPPASSPPDSAEPAPAL